MSTLDRLDVQALRKMITTFRDTVKEHAGGLNRLNVYPVPDGDTGTNMSRTLDAVVAEMDNADETDLEATCDAISHGSLMGARGNSGVILSQILRGLASTIKEQAASVKDHAEHVKDSVKDHASHVKEHAEDSGHKIAEALSAASTSAYQAVLKPIEGTILTVVRESADAAKASSAEGANLVEVLRAARSAGKTALDNTPELLPVLKDAGVVDAGGAGYLLLLDSALHVVDGVPLPEADDSDGPDASQLEAVAKRSSEVDGEIDVSEQRYEVMYFLDLVDDKIEDFKQGWGAIGDSIVVVGGDGIWNCHIHTNDIGASIEVPLDLGGRPKQIRVTDLFEEVAEEHAQREAAMIGGMAKDVPAALPHVETAVVAVCSGEGLVELFASCQVQGIVTGGQTLNPSTAELLETVDKVNADTVIILPNNKNIIPVAEQVDELTDKTVLVVPTTTMPEALAALFAYDPNTTVAENAADMNEAINAISTGEITQAVRDAKTPAGDVAVGDWMGLLTGDGIAAVASTLTEACIALLGHMLDDATELLTVLVGEGADAETTAAITAWVGEHHPDVQIDKHRGDQPLYPYLFGAE